MSNLNEKEYKLEVVGTFYRKEELSSILEESSEFFNLSNDNTNAILSGTKVYKYRSDRVSAKLEREPDNKFDPNAIKVIIKNVHVGYIPKNYCQSVSDQLEQGVIKSIKAYIHGGTYRIAGEGIDSVSEHVVDIDLYFTLKSDKDCMQHNKSKTWLSEYCFNICGDNLINSKIKKLLDEDFIYDFTKREIIEYNYYDMEIYRYKPAEFKAQLKVMKKSSKEVIGVFVDDTCIGYVGERNYNRVKRLIDIDNISSVNVNISKGRYKIVKEYYDYDKGTEKYSLEIHDINFKVSVKISLINKVNNKKWC